MKAMSTEVEQLQYFLSHVVEERAGIRTRQEQDDSIVYTLYSSPCYATVVGLNKLHRRAPRWWLWRLSIAKGVLCFTEADQKWFHTQAPPESRRD